MNIRKYQEFLAPACEISREAGKLIMGYFANGYTTSSKGEKGPVTDADIAANRYIAQALKRLTPDIPMVGEEDEVMSKGGYERFWLVDPLDGTRSFVRGEPEFTVNLGLIENGSPVLGVIYSPAQKTLYYGQPGAGAYRELGSTIERIHVRSAPREGVVVARSKSHPSAATQQYLDTLTIQKIISSGSSIKFCLIAEGSADIYPRFGRTMEWDTAAGHAILVAAGGRVETIDGKVLLYGKEHFENPHFIAFGG